jgi:hypothetical protein
LAAIGIVLSIWVFGWFATGYMLKLAALADETLTTVSDVVIEADGSLGITSFALNPEAQLYIPSQEITPLRIDSTSTTPLIPLVIQDSTTDTIMTITADGRIIGHDGRIIGQLDEYEIGALLR